MNIRNVTKDITRFTLILAIVTVIGMIMADKDKNTRNEGYIGRSEIRIADGKMTPEALLALGRLSDPQVSPDGKHILYGVSYNSVEENRSCRNLFLCNIDGSSPMQLTKSGKSISNARWSSDGSHIVYITGGQIWTAAISKRNSGWKLKNPVQVSDIPAGISEFKLSPDQKKMMYVSTVKSAVKAPSDCYDDLDKATAYTTDDLMYRHWDHTVMEIPHTYISDFSLHGEKSITPEASTDLLAGESGLYELPAEPFSGIEQLCWSPDSRFIAYSCRKLEGKRYAFSTNTEIYIYNIGTAQCEAITMGGGYDTDPVWSPDGSRICLYSRQACREVSLNWKERSYVRIPLPYARPHAHGKPRTPY